MPHDTDDVDHARHEWVTTRSPDGYWSQKMTVLDATFWWMVAITVGFIGSATVYGILH